VWQRCQVLFLCSPGNPTGAVLPRSLLQQALELAERYDFIIAADECYADIYLEEGAPPP
jgi:N-succinyldiaminopimelate aminotransferase